jgi:hypothetical protein
MRMGLFASGAVLLSLFVATAEAQEGVPVQVIDLAGPGEATRDVVPDGLFRILVVNVAPGRVYSYEIRRVVHPIEPLQLTKVQKAAPSCSPLETALGELQAPDLDEEKVSAVSAKVRRAISDCTDQDLRDLAEGALRRTELDLGTTAAARGEKIVVTVRREKRSWTATFDAGKRGEWQSSYGFIYSPPDDEKYFAKAAGDGKFQITREQDRGGYRFTPMAFYSWFPASRANRDLAVGATGGLGFQGDKPSVALGLTAIFNRNLSLVGGVLVRSVQRLSGQYDASALPQVGENLTEAQLHTSVYRATGFVGVTFRLGENPFAKGDSGAKPKEKAEEKPKEKAKDKPDGKDGQ